MQSLNVSKLLLLSGLAFSGNLYAQTVERAVLASDGGHFSGSSQSVSWTIGEPCSETLTGGTHVLTQGFQQPLLKLASIENYAKDEGNLFVYPNPVDQFLNLNFENLPIGNYVSELYDLRGVRLRQFKHQVAETSQTFSLELGTLPNAEYVLHVRSTDNRYAKSLKILILNPFQ